MLEVTAQGPGAVNGIVGAVDDVVLGPLGETHGELLVSQPTVELRHHQVDDVGDVVLGKGLIEHDLVQPVEELGPEGVLQQVADLVSGLLGDFPVGTDAVQQELRAQVRGKDDDGVLEIHRPALTICNTAVIQYLE